MTSAFPRARAALALFVCGSAIAIACGDGDDPGPAVVDAGDDSAIPPDTSVDDVAKPADTSEPSVDTGVDTSVDAPIDTGIDASDTADTRVDSTTIDTAPDADTATMDTAATDATDASAPPPSCFRYSQGASGYTASVPAIAPGGALAQVWAAAWTGSSPNLYARFGGADGGYGATAIEPIVGSTRGADVARNGGSFAAVFASGLPDAGNGVFFRAFDGGVAPDSGGAAVLVSPGVSPKLARGASEYGITWVNAASAHVFSRMSDSGALLDTPQTIGGTPILVAVTGAEYGVIYTTSAGVGIPAPIKLARFSAATGARVGTDVTIANYTSRASAAGTGDGYVLAWFDPGVDGGLGTYSLARFNASGTMQWKREAFGESVAWSGTEIALLYFTTSGSGVSTRANARLDRYTATGDPIPPQQVQSLGLYDPKGSSLEWTGAYYSYSFTSSGTGLSPTANVAIDCFYGSGLPIP